MKTSTAVPNATLTCGCRVHLDAISQEVVQWYNGSVLLKCCTHGGPRRRVKNADGITLRSKATDYSMVTR